MEDTIQEEYLEISPNILASFPKFRPPINLYIFNTEISQVQVYCKAEERLGASRQAEVAQYASDGLLFLSRADYKVYAKLLSEKLGLVLTEPNLNDVEVAEIFFQAFKTRLEVFFEQPIEGNMEPLRKDMSILCEYLWTDPARARNLKHPLGGKHSLHNHCVSTCFVGMGLFTMFFKDQPDTRNMLDAGLGFLLHDIGMSNVPEFILLKPTVLVRKERLRLQEHPAIGVKMVSRLNNISDKIIQCISEHHERTDGSGYAQKLTAAQLSPISRICAASDAYCAMISERVYAPAKEPKEAIMALVKEGKAFDPIIVKGLAQFILTD